MNTEISLIAQVLLTASALRRDAKVLEDHAADLERAALREDERSEYDEAIAVLREAPHAEECGANYQSCPGCGSSISNCRCNLRYSACGDAIEGDCTCWKSQCAVLAKAGVKA